MASITSLTGSSSSSSIYGTRNVISGLASGLDTEALIENAVSGYNTKITQLQQEKTKVEWKQESYRSIISKLSGFLSNYTTLTSSNNLVSRSFFTKSVITSAQGAHASKVSASGRTDSDVQLLGVKQLATSASRVVSGSQLSGSMTTNADKTTTVTGSEVDLAKAYGASMSITVDGVTKTVEGPSRSEVEAYAAEKGVSGENAYAALLQAKIDSRFGDGKLSVDNVGQDGKLQLAFTNDQVGSTFSVSGDGSKKLGLGSGVSNYLDTTKTLEELGILDSLTANEDGTYDLSINGVTIGRYEADTKLSTIMNDINDSDAGVTVNYSKTTNQLTFATEETGAMSSISMSGSLASLFEGTDTKGQDAVLTMSVDGVLMQDVRRSSNTFDVDGLSVTLKGTFGYAEDQRATPEGAAEGVYLINEDSLFLKSVSIDMKDGTTATYTANENMFINADGEAVDINGNLLPATISTNSDDVYVYQDAEGNALSAKEATAGEWIESTEAVTFGTSVDTETIVDRIKQMVEDFNAIMTEVKGAYSTMPLENSSGEEYKPLTDEDKGDMSESEIKNYEEKAKTGLLFGDNDLSSLYYQMLDVMNSYVSELEAVGISQSYSDGLTTLTVDEDKLTAALENDVDAVADIFVGADASGGLVKKLQSPLEAYGKTSGYPKGILVEKAGSTLASATLYDNELYNTLKDLDEEIDKWQDTIASKVDYYTSKFTYLEQLIAQMNGQSSMISGLAY